MKKIKVTEYIAQRLQELNCHHVFGVPGTSCSDFYDTMEETAGLESIITSNELEAGYAADGYARYAGLGACAVAYGVGTLSLVNAIAGCLVERSPVLVLNGGPSAKEIAEQEKYGFLFSHSTGRKETDVTIFKAVTIASKVIHKNDDMGKEIDELLIRSVSEYGPIYLEVPNDLWTQQIPAPKENINNLLPQKKNGKNTREFLEKAMAMAKRASQPVFYIGVDCVRLGLANSIQKMLEQNGIPYATTVLGKSILDEENPFYLGTYDTDLVVKPVRTYLEKSDCLIALGCVFGIDQRTLIIKHYNTMVNLTINEARIGTESYQDVNLAEFINGFRISLPKSGAYKTTRLRIPKSAPNDPLTMDGLFSEVDHFMANTSQKWQTVLDTCLGSFSGADLQIKLPDSYLANPVWLSIGHSTPASVGSWKANNRRPIVLTGDGGFQMVVQAVSSYVKYKVPAILIIMDNTAYAIEQFLIDSCHFVEPDQPLLPYVVLNNWNYEKMPELFAGGLGIKVKSRIELKRALHHALDIKDQPVIISATLASTDLPSIAKPFAEEECKIESNEPSFLTSQTPLKRMR